MELTGAAVAARKDRTMTRRGSVRVERWVRPPGSAQRENGEGRPWDWKRSRLVRCFERRNGVADKHDIGESVGVDESDLELVRPNVWS